MMPPRGGPKTRRVGANALRPLHRIKQLGVRVVQDGDNTQLNLTELSSAADELDKWIAKADSDDGRTPGVWTAVGNAGRTDLLALYALTLRRSCAGISPDVGESLRAAYASIRAKLSSELYKIFLDGTNDCIHTVVLAAIRAQTMRCLAALLADAAAQLAVPSQRRSRRTLQTAKEALTEARQLIELCNDFLSPSDEVGDVADGDIFIQAVADELRDSGVLEHWSRLLLLLASCKDGADEAGRQLHLLAPALLELEASMQPEWHHSLLLASPSLSYLLSSHVVGMCAALDGGPTYGMPRGTAQTDDDDSVDDGGEGASRRIGAVAPTYGATGLALRGHVPEGVSTQLTQWTLSLWSDTIQQEDYIIAAARRRMGPGRRERRLLSGTPPLNRAAAFEVSMRLAAAATAAMAATRPAVAAVAAAVGTPRSREREPGRRVVATEAPELALWALLCGRQALGDAAMTALSLTEAATRRMNRWWAALSAFLTATARQGGAFTASWDLLDRVNELEPVLSEAAWVRPLPSVAAALAAGYVPSLDSMLRALETSAEIGWAECLQGAVRPGWIWDQLFAFGPTSETTALIDTIGRLLDMTARRVPSLYDASMGAGAGSGGSAPPAADPVLLSHLCSAIGFAEDLYKRAVSKWLTLEVDAPGDDTAAADMPAGAPRLAAALSYIAFRLLPSVVEALLYRVLPATLDRGGPRAFLLSQLVSVSMWIGLAIKELQRGASLEIGPFGLQMLTQTDSGSSWRDLLMGRLRLPVFLGAALGLVASAEGLGATEARTLSATLPQALHLLAEISPLTVVFGLCAPETEQAAALAAGRTPLALAGGGLGPATRDSLRRLLGPGGLSADAELLALLEAICSAREDLERISDHLRSLPRDDQGRVVLDGEQPMLPAELQNVLPTVLFPSRPAAR